MKSKKYRDKDWLTEKYIDENKSISMIAIEAGVTGMTIHKYLVKNNIKRRTVSQANAGKYNGNYIDSPIRQYELMYLEYVTNNLSMREIAKKYKVSLRFVARILENTNIDTSEVVEKQIAAHARRKAANPKQPDPDKTCPNCGDKKSKQSKLCQACSFIYRNDHRKPSTLSFTEQLRQLTYQNWRTDIFARDEYTCQDCGDDSGGNLCAHHIIPFKYLRDRLVLENAMELDLTTTEGKNKLYEIAKKDFRISDLNNGITLCESCHKKEHNQIKYYRDFDVYRYMATVVSVLDGDTFVADLDLGFGIIKRETLRLYGINTCELKSKDIHQKGLAMKAKGLLQELLIPERKIVIRTYKPGKYGRMLCTVILDNLNINQYMIDTGLASEFIF